MKWILIVLLTISNSIALEIDQKLTFRVLKLSKTKKTVLMNRGLEDGLVVGDHAKFFLTYGVIARAVVVKASPSRSVWSVYRIVNGKDLNVDKVVRLKIATPLKLTEDPSKMIAGEDGVLGNDLGEPVNVARGDTKLTMREMPVENEPAMADSGEMDALREEPYNNSGEIRSGSGVSYPASYSNRTLEIFSMIHVSSFTYEVDADDETGNSSGSAKFVDFSLGFEKYFSSMKSFFGRLSIGGVIERMQATSSDLSGNEVEDLSFTYGLFANYHFFDHPLANNRLIGLVGLSFGLGSTEFTSVENNDEEEETRQADSNYFTVGVGLKYFTAWGLGFRLLGEYYSRGEEYPTTDGGNFTRVVTGPRLRAGLSYRW